MIRRAGMVLVVAVAVAAGVLAQLLVRTWAQAIVFGLVLAVVSVAVDRITR